jgi:hypothetical protein
MKLMNALTIVLVKRKQIDGNTKVSLSDRNV